MTRSTSGPKLPHPLTPYDALSHTGPNDGEEAPDGR